jgi:hypothetical protein
MKQDLSIKFEELEKSRIALFKKLDGLSKKEINFKKDPSKWSVTQIIFHLVKSEQLTCIAFRKNLEKTEKLNNSGILGFFRHVSLSLALKSSFKFKAPRMLTNMPDEYDIQELKNKWNTIRNNFGEALEKLPESIGNKATFKHPLAGWLNSNQMLDFLKNHFDHHYRQIQNLIEVQK